MPTASIIESEKFLKNINVGDKRVEMSTSTTYNKEWLVIIFIVIFIFLQLLPFRQIGKKKLKK